MLDASRLATNSLQSILSDPTPAQEKIFSMPLDTVDA
jgi:hypothetical protein